MGFEEVVLRYLTPAFIVGYAIRIELALRALSSNKDMKELVALMRWLAEEQTGKRPPPHTDL